MINSVEVVNENTFILGGEHAFPSVCQLENGVNYRQLSSCGLCSCESGPVVNDHACANLITASVHSASTKRHLDERGESVEFSN